MTKKTNPHRFRHFTLCLILVASGTSVLRASDATAGQVWNQTLRVPATGDEVVLLRLEQGMQEETRAKTDEQGRFSLPPVDRTRSYLLRVIHHGVAYDKPLPPNGPVSFNVFDVAARVQGITGTIEIIRIGAKGDQLHISDMIEVQNDSGPPRTQAGQHTFDVYLPTAAKIGSVMAAGPENVGILITAEPVSHDPGHYTVNFPLRPGSTKFAFNYDLPWDGHAAFRPRFSVPVQQLAVMVPVGMKFSSRTSAFQVLATGNRNYDVRAAVHLARGRGPAFEVSGAGNRVAAQLPSSSATSDSGTSSSNLPVLTAKPKPSTAILKTDGSLSHHRQTPLILLAAGVFLLAAALGVWRRRQGLRRRKPETRSVQPAMLLEGLKEELFQLEADRVRGSISKEEYASIRNALEETFRRTLVKAS